MSKRKYKYYSRWDKVQGYTLSIIRLLSNWWEGFNPLYFWVLDKVSSKAVEFSPIW